MDPASAKAAGYSGIIGYVSEDTTGKNLTRAQVDAAHTSGLDVGFVYEFDPKGALGGSSRGARDAQVAVSHAYGLGVPENTVLYTAIDFDAQPNDMPALWEYAVTFQRVAGSNGFRSGVYGSYALCWYLYSHGYHGMLWQTYAWSHGLWCNGLAVRQLQNGVHVAGATVDRDESEMVDWGQWPAVGQPGSSSGGAMSSITTDNIIKAWSEGDAGTVDDQGHAVSVEPVKWRQRDETWQAAVSAALTALTASVAAIGTGSGVLTTDQAADLHTIAEDLRKLTA